MSSEKWNSQTTIKFIQEFQLEECLWNVKSPAYKNKPARETSLRKIVEEMKIAGFGIPEARKKIRTLRSTYYQEKKKIQNSLRSGTGSESVYVPNLPWYKEMDNLLGKIYERRTTVENVCHSSPDNSVQEMDENLNLTQEDSTSGSDQVRTECPQPMRRNESKRKGIFRAIGELKQLQELINKDGQAEEKEDLFDVFGKSVAMQLRALSYERGMIGQAKIQNILTELSIEDYRHNSSIPLSTDTSLSSHTSSASRFCTNDINKNGSGDILSKSIAISLLNE